MDEFLQKEDYLVEKSKNDQREKKEIKKISGYMGWGLVIYSILGLLIGVGGVVFYVIVKNLFILKKTPNWNKLTDREMEVIFDSDIGEGLVAGFHCLWVIVGIAFLFLYFRKRIDIKQMFSSCKKMKLKTFSQIFCIMMGIQLIVIPGFEVMEKVLNYFGYSFLSSIESATGGSISILMVVYAVFLGPIAEELIYRGFVLFSLKKYGKILAILISAFLFGIMHGNIPQAIFAIGVGVVLGYVTVEYSILWAILLHVINNGLSDISYYLLKGLNEGVQNIIFYGVYGSLFLIGIYFVFNNRIKIKNYWMENKPKKKWLLYALTSFSIVLFIIKSIFEGILMLDKL